MRGKHARTAVDPCAHPPYVPDQPRCCGCGLSCDETGDDSDSIGTKPAHCCTSILTSTFSKHTDTKSSAIVFEVTADPAKLSTEPWHPTAARLCVASMKDAALGRRKAFTAKPVPFLAPPCCLSALHRPCSKPLVSRGRVLHRAEVGVQGVFCGHGRRGRVFEGEINNRNQARSSRFSYRGMMCEVP